MNLIVTDSTLNKEIDDKTYVLTTKPEIARAYKKGILINVSEKVTSEEVKMLLDEINQLIGEVIGNSKKLEMLWYMADCRGEGSSSMIINLYAIVKQCAFLKKIDIENAEIFYNTSNRQLCEVIRNYLINQKIKFLCNYDELGSRNKLAFFLDYSVKGGNYIYFNIIGSILALKIIRYSFGNLKRPKRAEYDLGMSVCSEGVRIYNWLLRDFNSISQFKYRILCMNATKTYNKLRKNGIDVDQMEDWIELGETIRKFKELFRLRYLIKRNFKNKYQFIFDGMDYSMAVKRYLLEYLYVEMVRRYKMHIICASYFKYNNFKVIEPWCTSSYPETRIFYINKNEEKFCKYHMYNCEPYRSEEKWPEMFDITFFSPIGYDIRTDFLKSYPQAVSYYYDIKEEYVYKKWLKNKREERYQKGGKTISILYAVQGSYYNRTIYEIIPKVEELLDVVKHTSWQLLCKFHPEDAKNECVREIAEKYRMFKNISFLDGSKGIEEYIEQADIVISGMSTVIFDSIVARKPVLVYLSKEEKEVISYLDNVVEMFTDIVDLTVYLEKVMNAKYFCQWKMERIEMQDTFFLVKKKSVVNRWKKIEEVVRG